MQGRGSIVSAACPTCESQPVLSAPYPGQVPGGGTERVGILGGTFDPLHVGHLVVASDARVALDLDRVLLVVAGDPWQKRGEVVAGPRDRLALVAAAVADIDGLAASAVEVNRDGSSVTADTLEAQTDVGR